MHRRAAHTRIRPAPACLYARALTAGRRRAAAAYGGPGGAAAYGGPGGAALMAALHIFAGPAAHRCSWNVSTAGSRSSHTAFLIRPPPPPSPPSRPPPLRAPSGLCPQLPDPPPPPDGDASSIGSVPAPPAALSADAPSRSRRAPSQPLRRCRVTGAAVWLRGMRGSSTFVRSEAAKMRGSSSGENERSSSAFVRSEAALLRASAARGTPAALGRLARPTTISRLDHIRHIDLAYTNLHVPPTYIHHFDID